VTVRDGGIQSGGGVAGSGTTIGEATGIGPARAVERGEDARVPQRGLATHIVATSEDVEEEEDETASAHGPTLCAVGRISSIRKLRMHPEPEPMALGAGHCGGVAELLVWCPPCRRGTARA